MRKKCKICSKLIAGRADGPFCSVRCESYYPTNLRRATRRAVNPIGTILHRNRSLLLEVMGKNAVQRRVERIILDRKKFNFIYHTHTHTNSAGTTYQYVYDLAWRG